MDLIVHQVVQLHDIQDPHRNLLIERLPGPAIVESYLSGSREPGLAQEIEDLLLGGGVKNGRGQMNALAVFLRQPYYILVFEFFDALIDLAGGQELFQATAKTIRVRTAIVQQLIDLLP